ncbi:MAG: ZIP family metal transporter [Acidobacteriota bacterium]
MDLQQTPYLAALLVFAAGLATALATGLGALPFYFIREPSDRLTARMHAIAGGLMLGASFGLLMEGRVHGGWQTLVGAAIGLIAIQLGEHFLHDHEINFGDVDPASAKQMVMILAIMTLHSFSEGVAVGVSFGGGRDLATLITVAIAVHNIPEGLAISAVLRAKGTSIPACAAWSIFSSLPQPLMAVPAFVFVELFRPFLPYGLGFAAGAMVYMVFLELLPEAYALADDATDVGLWLSGTLGAMVIFQLLL